MVYQEFNPGEHTQEELQELVRNFMATEIIEIATPDPVDVQRLLFMEGVKSVYIKSPSSGQEFIQKWLFKKL